MSAPFKDFDAIEVDQEPACTFKLGGREWHTKSRDNVPWTTVKNFFMEQANDSVGAVMLQVDEFFAAVLAPDELADFMALEGDTNGPLTYSVYTELVTFVASEVLGVPTEPPGGSPTGRQKTKSRSRASSSSKDKSPQLN